MKTIFIGTREDVLNEIVQLHGLNLIEAFVIKNSRAEKVCLEKNINYSIIHSENKTKIWTQINNINFDVLVSNGCPFIIPVTKLDKNNRIFVNVHPSYLPYYKGMHPINGVLLNNESYTGCTMHFMDDKIDNGNIIHQEKFDLTADLNLNILYDICFFLEAKVFRKGILKLMENPSYKGTTQSTEGSYYTRKESDFIINFQTDDTATIHNKIRAFSNGKEGPYITSKHGKMIILNAIEITNHIAIDMLKGTYKIGEVITPPTNQLIVKTLDSFLLILNYNSDFKPKVCQVL